MALVASLFSGSAIDRSGTARLRAAEDDSASAAAPSVTADELALIKAAEAARIAAIDRVYGAVVCVYGNNRQGGGSGVLFDPSGLALTNHHVVAAAGTEGWGGLADGKLYRWKMIGTDPGGDVAIIQLSGRDEFPFAPLGDSDTVRVGDWAMAMGNPFVLAEDQKPTVTLGIVSGVERYQEGAGQNMLVYGNCIQVDSSINPGNSGGPLFNMRGELLGINGRGSFQERGRVNVGLGYAISVNQIKLFLPDLLATKVAQHGTLDALFGERNGQVVCHTINLDAPVATAGLALGDRLISFEGYPITSTHQFTNLISTLPAEWPAELVVQSEGSGERKVIHSRLLPLPYGADPEQPPDMPPDMPPDEQPEDKQPDNGEQPKPDDEQPAETEKPAEGEKPSEGEKATEGEQQADGEKPADGEAPADGEKPAEGDKSAEGEKPVEGEKPAEDPKPEQPPMPMPMPQVRRPQISVANAGVIRDEEVNIANCRRIVARWQATTLPQPLADEVQAIRLTDDVLRAGHAVGQQQIVLAVDGRFRVDYRDGETDSAYGFDGERYWAHEGLAAPQVLATSKALLNPVLSQAATLAAVFDEEPLARFGKVLLDGGDKALGQPAYRVKSIDDRGDWFYVWLSVLGEDGQPGVRLLKSGADIDGKSPAMAVTFADWRSISGMPLPFRRALVDGISENEVVQFQTVQAEALSDLSQEMFEVPGDAATDE